jgi:hypothetical protein
MYFQNMNLDKSAKKSMGIVYILKIPSLLSIAFSTGKRRSHGILKLNRALNPYSYQRLEHIFLQLFWRHIELGLQRSKTENKDNPGQ